MQFWFWLLDTRLVFIVKDFGKALLKTKSTRFSFHTNYPNGNRYLKLPYVLTQPDRELLSNRYGTRTTQHMHDQTTSVQSPIAPHVVHKSVEFSGVSSLTHSVIINTYCAGVLFTIQIIEPVIFASWDWPDLRFEGCFDSLFVIFFPVINALYHGNNLRVVEWVALIRFLFGMWHY